MKRGEPHPNTVAHHLFHPVLSSPAQLDLCVIASTQLPVDAPLPCITWVSQSRRGARPKTLTSQDQNPLLVECPYLLHETERRKLQQIQVVRSYIASHRHTVTAHLDLSRRSTTGRLTLARVSDLGSCECSEPRQVLVAPSVIISNIIVEE